MRKILGLLSCVMMASCSAGNDAAPSKAAITPAPLEKAHLVNKEVTEKYEQLLLKGYKVLGQGHYKAAIHDHFDPIIRYYTDKIAGKTDQTLYSVRGSLDALHYMFMAAAKGKDASAISYIWAEALYLKGYTTLEVGGTVKEAKAWMEKALKLSPAHSRFLSELAHLYGTEKKWKKSQEIYEQAEEAAIFSPENVREIELLRAKRGIGFSLIERGMLATAERKYKECLAIDPNDKTCQLELRYIVQIRKNRK